MACEIIWILPRHNQFQDDRAVIGPLPAQVLRHIVNEISVQAFFGACHGKNIPVILIHMDAFFPLPAICDFPEYALCLFL